MRRPTIYALLCLTLLLVLFPLAAGKPGLPMTLKADEPAYLLMALSLARDGDLLCGLEDLGRLFDEYPYLATFNLILMTDDGWHTVYFGKPYIYSLFAAPLAGVFGANGLVALNMALLMSMVWMGASFLSRYNPAPLAALYSAGFFLLSTSFAYVFWLHPEILNMTSVAASLHLALHRFDDTPSAGRLAAWRRRLFGPATRPAWSGALLALAVYNKPMLLAMALPSLFAYLRRRRLRALLVWALACGIGLALLAGVAVLLTGHPSAYLGVERMGVPVFDPSQMPLQPVERPPTAETPTTNSWTWLIRIPEIDWPELATHMGYFLWGRHTGLIPYMPFAIISLLLFLIHGHRSAERWVTLLAIAAVAVFFLVWIPFNWHGGGGFIGNRYFVNVYPAFLFLVTAIRPAALTAVGYAAAGLWLGPILFTPFGAPVPDPTLQAHVRNPPFRWFPLELGFRKKLPGYEGASVSGAWFFARKDVFEKKGDELWLHGAVPVELWMLTSEPVDDELVFVVANHARRNRLTMSLAGVEQQLDFLPDPPAGGESRQIELRPKEPPLRLREEKRWVWAHRLLVTTATGVNPTAARNAARKYPVNDFYLGVSLLYLGSRSELARDLYSVGWDACEAAPSVTAGETFTMQTALTNDSGESWPAKGPTRVNLSYHWLSEEGEPVVWEGRRTELPSDLRAGRSVRAEQIIVAPQVPGRYVLELDLVRERVSWFSQKRPGAPCRSLIEVVPVSATADSPAP